MEGKILTLCRICLEEGATNPLFESNISNDEKDTLNKLYMCLNEKIEDLDGYPRYICNACNDHLDAVCSFINKYWASNKILSSGAHKLKKEIDEYNSDDISCNEQSEVEIDISDIKNETSICYNSDSSVPETQTLPLLEQQNIKKSTKNKIKSKIKKSTNNVASSILEGEFMWNGRYWCFKNYVDNPDLRNNDKKNERQKSLKVKLVLPRGERSVPQKLCDLCGEVFKNQDKLSNHKRKVHFKKPVKCPKCPQLIASEYYLMRHLKRKHEGQKNNICSMCGRGFAFKGELTSHIKKVHDKSVRDKKQYTCKICNKSYACQKSVIVHERSAHTGHRPAVCRECGTSFYHEDYLKEHMRLHTGETPFKCPICGRGYAQRGNMKSHLRIHKISELDSVTLSKLKPNYLKLLKS